MASPGPRPTRRTQPPQALEITLLDRQRRRRVAPAPIRALLQRTASELRVAGAIAVVLTGDRALRAWNRRYRGKDQPTDVLSFPGPGGEAGLGDILISLDSATRNARSARHSLARELRVLALHGFLHVLGYDHETDDGTMERLERRLRRKLLGATA